MAILRIALLHLAPMLGDVETNRRLIEKGITTAADLGAGWIVTPELVVSGYAFAKQIGTDWILPQPDPWVTYICRIAAQRRVAIFLSHPERDRRSNRLHNTIFAIAPDGTITGSHRKINALRVGSEAWSTPGEEAAPVYVPPFDSVGLLVCADAYSPWITKRLHEQGARILVSSAAWAPGLHGPDGEWERCTRDTGLPLIVCNRTGPDQTLNFTTAESVVVKDGRRLLSLTSEQSTIFVVDWNLRTQDLHTLKHGTVRL